MTEYVLVTDWTRDTFIALCNEKLAQGYTPIGGVSLTAPTTQSVKYAQAFGK
jgi:hypothetical protein